MTFEILKLMFLSLILMCSEKKNIFEVSPNIWLGTAANKNVESEIMVVAKPRSRQHHIAY
jgi:hypothetical protein